MPEAKWYHNRVLVVLMLFVVLGPAGLPLLWKSPHFSRRWKQILTVLTWLYTVLVIRMFVSTLQTSFRTLNSMGSSL